MTSNLEKRIRQHNAGYSKSTKPYKPWVLIYSEETADSKSGRKSEKYFKSGIGRELIRNEILPKFLIDGQEVSGLSADR